MTKTLTIGIDAKPLTRPLAGIGRYLSEILLRMAKHSSHRFILYSPGPLHTKIFEGISNIEIKHAHITNPIGRQIWAQTILPWQVTQDKIDVLWCPAHIIPLALPKTIPTVVTIHDLVWRHAPQTMRPLGRLLDTLLMPHALAHANTIITVSQSTANDVMCEMPSTHKKTHVIPLAGNLSNHTNTQKASRFGKNYFLFVGTLEPRKNLHRLLSAYAQLSPTLRARHRLVIIGGQGWGKIDIMKIIAKHKLIEHVDIAGWLDDSELVPTYQHAYALCMPSLYEGFGLPILEALQCGVPVITSNISSMPEVAGAAGLLVNPLSTAEIATALLTLAEQPALHSQLTAAATAQAARFSWETAAQLTHNILLETTSTNGLIC